MKEVESKKSVRAPLAATSELDERSQKAIALSAEFAFPVAQKKAKKKEAKKAKEGSTSTAAKLAT